MPYEYCSALDHSISTVLGRLGLDEIVMQTVNKGAKCIITRAVVKKRSGIQYNRRRSTRGSDWLSNSPWQPGHAGCLFAALSTALSTAREQTPLLYRLLEVVMLQRSWLDCRTGFHG